MYLHEELRHGGVAAVVVTESEGNGKISIEVEEVKARPLITIKCLRLKGLCRTFDRVVRKQHRARPA